MQDKISAREFKPSAWNYRSAWILAACWSFYAVLSSIFFDRDWVSIIVDIIFVFGILLFAAFYRRVWSSQVVRVEDEWLTSTQLELRELKRIKFQDLASFAWENPKIICFNTSTHEHFFVNMRALRKAQRKEIRKLLSEKLMFYKAAI